MQAGLVLYAFVVFGVGAVLLVYFLPGTKLRLPALENALRFCWTCFLKPHTGDASYAQQDALESFYKTQASVYDATRTRLLRGREDMLGLVAAQVTHRVENGEIRPKPIWVDVRYRDHLLTDTRDSHTDRLVEELATTSSRWPNLSMLPTSLALSMSWTYHLRSAA